MLSEKNYCEAKRLKELKVYMFLHFVHILDFLSIHVFYKKLRIWASTEGFLKLSDIENSEFLTSFSKVA